MLDFNYSKNIISNYIYTRVYYTQGIRGYKKQTHVALKLDLCL